MICSDIGINTKRDISKLLYVISGLDIFFWDN